LALDESGVRPGFGGRKDEYEDVMKVLLRKDIPKLGLAGDLVDVRDGFARNYLLPHHLALEPSKGNLKKVEDDKRVAAEERARRHEFLKREIERLAGVEVHISAAANEEGQLYGSVTAREISRALMAEGHSVQPDQVKLDEPIKHLDTRMVTVSLGEDYHAEVKVWIVREKTAADLAAEKEAAAAGTNEATGETATA